MWRAMCNRDLEWEMNKKKIRPHDYFFTQWKRLSVDAPPATRVVKFPRPKVLLPWWIDTHRPMDLFSQETAELQTDRQTHTHTHTHTLDRFYYLDHVADAGGNKSSAMQGIRWGCKILWDCITTTCSCIIMSRTADFSEPHHPRIEVK